MVRINGNGYDLNLIRKYLMNKQISAENDVIQLSNNVVYRSADPLDHLEMIMAQVRRALVEEMSLELYYLLRIIEEEK